MKIYKVWISVEEVDEDEDTYEDMTEEEAFLLQARLGEYPV